MNEQIVALVQAYMAGDQQAVQQVNQIMQAAQQGDQQAAQIAQMIQTVAQQLSQKAKFGAKLNYLKQLKGNCPEGYELRTFKIGGKVCQKCQKASEGTEFNEKPKNVAEAFKCGRKMKKKAEDVKEAKCGSKVKKKEDGGKTTSKSGFPFSIAGLNK